MTDSPNPQPLVPSAPSMGVILLRVAWASIAVGVGLEILLLLMATFMGQAGKATPFIADLVQKLSWSFLVCVGLAMGAGAARAARSLVMGLLGLLAAPSAFAVAKALHKGVAHALSLPDPTAAGPSPWVIAGIKAVEYGCLGLAVSWAARWYGSTPRVHAAVGAAVALVFGGTLIGLAAAQTPPPSNYALAARSLNELLFPIACSFVLFASSALTERVERPTD